MHEKQKAPDNAKHGVEGPNSYHTIKPPSAKELGAPVKIYPDSSKLGKDRGKSVIEGPCSEHGEYHR